MSKASTADNLPLGWAQVLAAEFQQQYMQDLRSFLLDQKRHGAQIYPETADTFRAFQLCDFARVKVIILGQDPYHGPRQAHGLSFSVRSGIKAPPSLANIFKELESDLGWSRSKTDLSDWAEQGVLLLNSVLTVTARSAGSHRNQGWETFTDKAISALAQQRQGLVFILWGSYARAKKQLIDSAQHCIIESAHPSPLSAHNGFFGSKPFSRCNNYLSACGQEAINW